MVLLELVIVLEDDLQTSSDVSERGVLEGGEDECEKGGDEVFGDVELGFGRDSQ